MAAITEINNWLFEFNRQHKLENSRQSIEAVHSALAYVNNQLKRLSDFDNLTSTNLNYLQGNVRYLAKQTIASETIHLIKKLFKVANHQTCHNPREEENFWNSFSFILKGVPRKEWNQETFDQLITFCIELHSVTNGNGHALSRFVELFATTIDKKYAQDRWNMVSRHLLPAYYHLSEELAKWLMLNVEFYRLKLDEFPLLHSLASMPKDKQNLIVEIINFFFHWMDTKESWKIVNALRRRLDKVCHMWNRLSPEQQSQFKKGITKYPLESVQELISRLNCYTSI